ncbi:hypothetical protein ACJX0J_019771, partial [Zea mays]
NPSLSLSAAMGPAAEELLASGLEGYDTIAHLADRSVSCHHHHVHWLSLLTPPGWIYTAQDDMINPQEIGDSTTKSHVTLDFIFFRITLNSLKTTSGQDTFGSISNSHYCH